MEKQKSVLNIPTIISLFRFVCVPVVVALFLIPMSNGVGVFCALGLYIIGSLSDALDGYIARKYNMITNFGKFIDQIADKFLQTTGLILVLFAGSIEPGFIAIIILLIIVLRDIEISGIRMVAASKGAVIPADMFGKIKSNFIDIGTVLLMLFVGMKELNGAGGSLWFIPNTVIQTIGFAVIITGAILSIVSCINYTVKAWPLIITEDEKKEDNKKTKPSKKKEKDPLEDLLTASGAHSVSKEKQYKNSDKIYTNENTKKTK